MIFWAILCVCVCIWSLVNLIFFLLIRFLFLSLGYSQFLYDAILFSMFLCVALPVLVMGVQMQLL